MRLCKFTFTIISSLPCLHTFWHAIPTSFHILTFIKSCPTIGLRNPGIPYLKTETLASRDWQPSVYRIQSKNYVNNIQCQIRTEVYFYKIIRATLYHLIINFRLFLTHLPINLCVRMYVKDQKSVPGLFGNQTL